MNKQKKLEIIIKFNLTVVANNKKDENYWSSKKVLLNLYNKKLFTFEDWQLKIFL